MIAFAAAEHFLPGSDLAGGKLRTILPRLLTAVDTIEVAGDPEWAQANFVGGGQAPAGGRHLT